MTTIHRSAKMEGSAMKHNIKQKDEKYCKLNIVPLSLNFILFTEFVNVVVRVAQAERRHEMKWVWVMKAFML